MASHGRCLGMAQSCSRSVRHMHPCRPRSRAVIRAAAAANWDAVYAGESLPAPFAGPVAVQEVPGGKGRGLVATRDITPGELLLVDTPLVYMTADEEGKLPELKELQAQLLSQQHTAHQRAWLEALDAGLSQGAPGPTPALGPGGESGANAPASSTPLDGDKVLKQLEINQCAGDSADIPLCIIRGEAPVGFRGLWPQFSMVNHSCAPNAEYQTIHDRLVVRAASTVPKGTEVTVSYLGPQTLRPAAERLMDLRESKDFACTCPRCEAEMDDSNGPLIASVHEVDTLVMYDLVPSLQSTLGTQGLAHPSALSLVEGGLSRLQPVIEKLERKLKGEGLSQVPSTEVASWFKASAYQAYSIQAQLLEFLLELKAGTPEEAAVTARLLQAENQMMDVAEPILPASDAQLLQAVKSWARAQQSASADVSSTEPQAEARAMHVLGLRYGSGLSEEARTRLIQAVAAALTAQ